MKEYEIVFTYLNGCAGAAYPQRSFEEVELNCPEEYIKAKHTKDYDKFLREEGPDGQVVYRYSNGAVTYIYEFNELLEKPLPHLQQRFFVGNSVYFPP